MFETLIIFVSMHALEDRVGVVCKNMGPCVEVGDSVGGGHNEEGVFYGLEKVFA